MENDVQQRFGEIEKRFDNTEKRLDDVKWYVGGIAGFFSLFFAVLTLVTSMNITSEKASLLDFERNLREDVGKAAAIPDLRLLGSNRAQLDGQDLVASFETEDGRVYLLLEHSLKNEGTGSTGKWTAKLYTKKQLKLHDPSTDEREYDYEAVFPSRNTDELPGGFSMEAYLRVDLADSVMPPPGTYASLIKIFYGNGKIAQARINVIVPPRK